MNRTTWMAVHGALITVLLGGCSDGKKQRLVRLEDQNRSLAMQLQGAADRAAECERQRNELRQQLLLSQREAADLKMQLANMPEPAPEEVAPGWTPVPGGAMIAIEGEILFQSGQKTLKSDARSSLDSIVRTLQGEYGEKDVFVVGHTDNVPIKKSGFDDNFQLSSERALAVARYLRDHGVPPVRLMAAGCGEYRPRASNESASNRSANRRVEIYAIDRDLSPGRS